MSGGLRFFLPAMVGLASCPSPTARDSGEISDTAEREDSSGPDTDITALPGEVVWTYVRATPIQGGTVRVDVDVTSVAVAVGAYVTATQSTQPQTHVYGALLDGEGAEIWVSGASYVPEILSLDPRVEIVEDGVFVHDRSARALYSWDASGSLLELEPAAVYADQLPGAALSGGLASAWLQAPGDEAPILEMASGQTLWCHLSVAGSCVGTPVDAPGLALAAFCPSPQQDCPGLVAASGEAVYAGAVSGGVHLARTGSEGLVLGRLQSSLEGLSLPVLVRQDDGTLQGVVHKEGTYFEPAQVGLVSLDAAALELVSAVSTSVPTGWVKQRSDEVRDALSLASGEVFVVASSSTPSLRHRLILGAGGTVLHSSSQDCSDYSAPGCGALRLVRLGEHAYEVTETAGARRIGADGSLAATSVDASRIVDLEGALFARGDHMVHGYNDGDGVTLVALDPALTDPVLWTRTLTSEDVGHSLHESLVYPSFAEHPRGDLIVGAGVQGGMLPIGAAVVRVRGGR